MPAEVVQLKLPDQETQGHSAAWEPETGILTIETQRGRQRHKAVYVVDEIPVDWPGRGFQFSKPEGEPGSDEEADQYTLFLSPAGTQDTCECRGFLRWKKPCKHLSALRQLVEIGEL